MFKWIHSRIGIKLLVTISIVLILSMVSLNYLATNSVMEFGEFSANINETSIRNNTNAFLSRATNEQTGKYEAIFKRISDSSSMLAKWAGFLVDNIALFDDAACDPNDELVLYPPNGIYSNRPSQKTMVLYWGSPIISPEIAAQLNTFSFIDPFLAETRKANPESVASFIVTKSAICRYYPNIHSVIRLSPSTEYDMRSSNFYAIAGPEKNPKRKTVWTNIYQDPSGQGLMMTTSTPIYSKRGEFFGIAGISVTLDSIMNEILGNKGRIQDKEGAGTFSFLIDHEGVIIAMPPEYIRMLGIEIDTSKLVNASVVLESSLLSSSNEEVKKLGRKMINKVHETTRIVLDGSPYIVSSHSMPQTKWHFGFVIPESVVLASVQETREGVNSTVGKMTKRFIVVTILFLLSSILIVAVFLIKSVIRPLGGLSKAALRVKDGDLTTRLDIHRNDEIGALASSFNNMVSALRKGKELEKKSALTLEKKVEERTGEIRRRTEELQGTLHLLKQEIGERELAETALRESEEKFKSLGENAPDIIYTLGVDGIFTYVNSVWEEILGHKREEVVGRYFVDFVRKEQSEGYVQDLQRVIGRKETIRDRSVTLLHKDGSLRFFNMSGAPNLNSEGMVTGMVGLFKDITEQLKLEAHLKQAQKLESIGTLTGGVAHNFRNILAIVLGSNQLLQMNYKDDPDLLKIAETITGAVNRGVQLVDGLMVFSHKQAKHEFCVVNLAEVIRETYQLISKSFDKRISITIDIPQSLPVTGDHAALCQVIINLCTNARDAMSGGGELRLEARKEDENALAIISDTGHGMDKESLEKCFDPFYTTKEVGKGTGLGLFTIYGVVKDHGGEIHVYSEPGKGTTFKLYLPMASMRTTYIPKDEHVIIKGNGEKILFVDDEVEVVEPLKALLEKLDYRVAYVSSGKEAIDKYKSWKPDVVLLDRNMPEMDGISCAKRIIEHDGAARIVLFSGYDEVGPYGIDTETRALLKGYIVKPVRLKDLANVFSRLFNTK